jgi:N-acyl homoserine lactone hydrolase
MSLTIHPLVPSRLVVETGRMTYLRNYGSARWFPCPFYVVKGGKEPIVVDTSGSAAVMSKLRKEPVEDVCEFEQALAAVDLGKEDVTCVVQTHLMYDHCANNKLLPNARVVVQKKELDFALAPHPMYAGVYQRHLFEDLNFEIVEGDVELAPGIRLLFTPGHSPGGQSVAVSTEKGLAVITGFCCIGENFSAQQSPAWVSDFVPEVIPPGIHTDMLQAYESALRVKNTADIIIPFHDPKMAARKRIPEGTP